MRLHNFFVSEKLDGKNEITIFDPSLINQLRNVLRLHHGDKVILLDNSGSEFHVELVSFSPKMIHAKILKTEKNKNIPKREVTLFQSLLKKDKLEWVFEKGTELGVSRFAPALSERSEKKSFNVERAEKIIREAAEQSGRGTLPALHKVQNLKELMELSAKSPVAFHTEGEKIPDIFLSSHEPVSIFIGPEGGWTEKEITFFKSKNIPIYCLGTQVLRAETAAVSALSLFLLN